MRICFFAMVMAATASLAAQERKIPKDSELVSIRGCARDRTFIVGGLGGGATGTVVATGAVWLFPASSVTLAAWCRGPDSLSPPEQEATTIQNARKAAGRTTRMQRLELWGIGASRLEQRWTRNGEPD